MLPKLIQGRIVWASVPDPQGQNVKRRRCVAIDVDMPIDGQMFVRIVGITTEMTQSPQSHYVPLPYARPPQKSWSGLVESCAALCTWVIDIDESLVEITPWFIPPKYVDAMQASIETLEKNGHPIPVHTIRRDA